MGKKIGIDLGTTYSCVSYVDDIGVIKIVNNIDNQATTPSIVYFDPDGTATVGEMARQAGGMHPELIVERVKNYMGDPNYKFFANGKEYSAAAVSTLILRQLVADAERLIGEEIEGAVITCPAYFGEEARNATKEAGENVVLSNGNNLKVLKILDEPTAAAIAYGNSRQEDMDKTVLIYDLGGGTFDCTVMKLSFHGKERKMDIITTGGNHKLGGKDWDEALTELVRQKFIEKHPVDEEEMKNDVELNAYFSVQIENLKKCLTGRDSAGITVQYAGEKERIEVTREEFEEATSDLLNETISLVNDMLEKKNLDMMNDIDEIILVGGSTYMPQVRDRLAAEYNKVISQYEPNKVVAMGAALLAKECDEADEKERHYLVYSDSFYGIALKIAGVEKAITLARPGESFLDGRIKCKELGIDVFYKRTEHSDEVLFTVFKNDNDICAPSLYDFPHYADVKIKFKEPLMDRTPLDVELYICEHNRTIGDVRDFEEKLIVTNKLNGEICEANINWRTQAWI